MVMVCVVHTVMVEWLGSLTEMKFLVVANLDDKQLQLSRFKLLQVLVQVPVRV